MSRIWGNARVVAAGIVLIIACVLAYFLLLYLVTPHHSQDDDGGYVVTFPNASNDTAGGLVVVSGYNVSLTPEQAALADTGGADGTVNFWELPLWIQLYALPGMIVGLAVSLLAAAFVVRRARKNENENKREVYTYITDNPGCTAPELARGRGLNLGTARYHIHRLKDEGRIVLQKIGKYTRIFVNSHTYDEREKLIAAHLHSDNSCRIIGALMDAPGISNQRLAEKLGMEKSLVFRHVQRLMDDGIVTFEMEGKSRLYFISQDAKDPLIRLMPRHYQCPGLMKG
jgi:predicted transcriptional regulator